jgi:hypothetical protein
MGAANLVALLTSKTSTTPALLDIDVIAATLAPIAPPACGSCHKVTLGGTGLTSGRHSTHVTVPTGTQLASFTATTSCGICHGAGYTTSSNGNLLTHNNGFKTVAATISNVTWATGAINWVAPIVNASGVVTTRGNCTPACHTFTAGGQTTKVGKQNW